MNSSKVMNLLQAFEEMKSQSGIFKEMRKMKYCRTGQMM